MLRAQCIGLLKMMTFGKAFGANLICHETSHKLVCKRIAVFHAFNVAHAFKNSLFFTSAMARSEAHNILIRRTDKFRVLRHDGIVFQL